MAEWKKEKGKKKEKETHLKRDETRPNYVEKTNFVDRDKIAEEIAKEMGLEGEEVLKAVKMQFQYLAITIREGELNQLRLPSFGRFYTTWRRVNSLIAHGKVLDRKRIEKDVFNHLDYIMGRGENNEKRED